MWGVICFPTCARLARRPAITAPPSAPTPAPHSHAGGTYSSSYHGTWFRFSNLNPPNALSLSHAETGLGVLGPEDLDVVELHDNFTVSELEHIVDLGLCREEEVGALMERGEFDNLPGKGKPQNLTSFAGDPALEMANKIVRDAGFVANPADIRAADGNPDNSPWRGSTSANWRGRAS